MTDGGRRPGPLPWHPASLVAVRSLTPLASSYLLRTRINAFRAGQHIDVRLTAADGATAQRAYSIASAPTDAPLVEIIVVRQGGGEVSSFFHDTAAPGDPIEVRGPIGGPFTWMPEDGGPLLLAAGGSGVVPLLAMLRARAGSDPAGRARAALLYSVASEADAIALPELRTMAAAGDGFDLRLHVTRARAADAPTGRIDAAAISAAVAGLGDGPVRAFACGPGRFVAAVTGFMVEAGLPPGRIRTERFGD